MNLTDLRVANTKRAEELQTQPFDLSFRGNELAGEVGEACNVIKKLERLRYGFPASISKDEALASLEEELADVLICVDLIGMDLGINLSEALRNKFNKSSKKFGSTVYL